MAKGHKTGGRKPGTKNKRTKATQEAVEASGLTPLDYMLGVMRDRSIDWDVRLSAAKAAAPYVHATLKSIELGGKDGQPIEQRVVLSFD